jgi:hypothetical protein
MKIDKIYAAAEVAAASLCSRLRSTRVAIGALNNPYMIAPTGQPLPYGNVMGGPWSGRGYAPHGDPRDTG